jgi:hypothetical protein
LVTVVISLSKLAGEAAGDQHFHTRTESPARTRVLSFFEPFFFGWVSVTAIIA